MFCWLVVHLLFVRFVLLFQDIHATQLLFSTFLSIANYLLTAAASYFNFTAFLTDLVPVTTFSSRQSSVEWIRDGSHLTPIVLSPVILDQCKVIILDSYVRSLFNCAIDVDALNVKEIISKKDGRDKKLEKDLEEILTESSISVAAREAMVDRTKGFWQRSKWAKKLQKIVS